MKFTLKKVHGGLHPVIRCTLNGERVQALIDTGANITCHGTDTDKPIFATIVIDGMTCGGRLPKFGNTYKLILGSDFLDRTGAVIDYHNRTITFKK